MLSNIDKEFVDNIKKKGFTCLDFSQRENGLCGLG